MLDLGFDRSIVIYVTKCIDPVCIHPVNLGDSWFSIKLLIMKTDYFIPLNAVEHDKICWKPNKSNGFAVSGYMTVL